MFIAIHNIYFTLFYFQPKNYFTLFLIAIFFRKDETLSSSEFKRIKERIAFVIFIWYFYKTEKFITNPLLLRTIFKQILLKKNYILLGLTMLISFVGFSRIKKFYSEKESLLFKCTAIYQKLHLSTIGLKEDVFIKAMTGWNSMLEMGELCNTHVLSIIDFSQSDTLKRLYIIDIEKAEVLFNTYVAHGRNSGDEFARSFSNKVNSYKSSLGFYITGNTYIGKNGLSLQLKGVENGINNFAEKRGIVVHGANYVSDLFIKINGHLGRSFGCPAIPKELSAPIINLLKEGSCLFIYYPDSYYLKTSRFQ